MPSAVIPIDAQLRSRGTSRRGTWSLLEVAVPGNNPVPLGILLVDEGTDGLNLRLRDAAEIEDLEEQEIDILALLADDLRMKARANGARALIDSLDELSGFFRINDRTPISFTGDPQRATDRLYDEYVDRELRPFVTHLPLFGLRAAATRFGEGMESEQEGWLRAPENLRLTPEMFIARVVGRSMEPLIPDGSLCIFRSNVTGTRQGKRLLIEKFGETDFASRYTVKRYTSRKKTNADGDWEHERIRLEPLNPEFDAFELGPDEFRVVAEFVDVLGQD